MHLYLLIKNDEEKGNFIVADGIFQNHLERSDYNDNRLLVIAESLEGVKDWRKELLFALQEKQSEKDDGQVINEGGKQTKNLD